MKDNLSQEGGLVKTAVAAHIERVTRFDGRDLTEAEPEKFIALPIELTLIQEVSFAADVTSGASRLPASAENVFDKTAFQSELEERLAKARTDAPLALQVWCDSKHGSYRELISKESTFLENLSAVGYEHTCADCDGAGKLRCGTCAGSGHTSCTSCGGDGWDYCYRCSGTKRVSCAFCSGRGRWSEQVQESSWDHALNTNVINYRTVYHSCPHCGGDGQERCIVCRPDGTIDCRTCDGDGKLRCTRCGATGHVDCGSCHASGIRHVMGEVVATITTNEQLNIFTDNTQLKTLINSKLSRSLLPDYGALDEAQHSVTGNVIETTHRLHLDVREARLCVGAETFVLYGFGPTAQVFNFENIAGHMLADDLGRLEKSVESSSRWQRSRVNSELPEALNNFLQSELNLLLAENVSVQDGSLSDASKAAQRRFGELVDSSYVSRATIALRSAIARVYDSELLEPAASLCALGALMSGVFYWIGWYQPRMLLAVLCGFVVSTLSWFVFEWLTRRRLAKRFEDNIAPRILTQLRINGSIKRWRMRMTIAILVANVAGVVVANTLPQIHLRHQGLSTQAENDQLLDLWFEKNAAIDVHQRQYPVNAYLFKEAESGNDKAIIVLAWKLLLGAGDASKNVNEAKRWLEKASEATKRNSVWKIAWAVQTINRDAMPDEIKAASQILRNTSGLEEIEARYWLARVYLAEHSPIHDARLGLNLLTRAADLRHAHAAFLLGQKYAKGDGVAQNSHTARRYLLTAAEAGLLQAKDALNQLR